MERSYDYGNNLYKDRCYASTSRQIPTTIIDTDTVTRCVTTGCKSDDDFSVDVVTICLTDNCDDCTGSYSNHILRHRLICKCRCHKRDEVS